MARARSSRRSRTTTSPRCWRRGQRGAAEGDAGHRDRDDPRGRSSSRSGDGDGAWRAPARRRAEPAGRLRAATARALEALGVEPVRVALPARPRRARRARLPGGESTTMLRLLEATGLRAPLEAFVRERPVLGTCAGRDPAGARARASCRRRTLGVLDVTVERNAYGRQIDSFSAAVEAPGAGRRRSHGVFIRAPRIRRVGAGVEVVARARGRRAGRRARRARSSGWRSIPS